MDSRVMMLEVETGRSDMWDYYIHGHGASSSKPAEQAGDLPVVPQPPPPETAATSRPPPPLPPCPASPRPVPPRAVPP
eukprot:10319369-Lingulodinium_polyedra.AAC.1